jgi:hypothetical protein
VSSCPVVFIESKHCQFGSGVVSIVRENGYSNPRDGVQVAIQSALCIGGFAGNSTRTCKRSSSRGG